MKRPEALPLFCTAFAITYLAFSGANILGTGPRGARGEEPGAFVSGSQGLEERLPYLLETISQAKMVAQKPRKDFPAAPARESGAEEESSPLPRPLRSQLLLSKHHLGGIDASLLVYESWGELSSLERFLVQDYQDAGWSRERRFEELSGNLLPGMLFAFTRGQRRCLVSIERIRQTGKIETLCLSMKKDWLPPGSGI